MLLTNTLKEKIIENCNSPAYDKLIIISGYVGLSPIVEVASTGIKTELIYGMYGAEGISVSLHEYLKKISSEYSQVDIFYSTIPVHSKCYIWEKEGHIQEVLIGSANFSENGLNTPLREMLITSSNIDFVSVLAYYNTLKAGFISCTSATPNTVSRKTKHSNVLPSNCSLPLYVIKSGKQVVPKASGINWGHGTKAHVRKKDSYIPIHTSERDAYPNLFPEKRTAPSLPVVSGRKNRQNDAIEVLWDDGTSMQCLMEGSCKRENTIYPKQISSEGDKSILGDYLRTRLGLASGALVEMKHLRKYGRKSVDVSLLGDGVYYFDFSSKK